MPVGHRLSPTSRPAPRGALPFEGLLLVGSRAASRRSTALPGVSSEHAVWTACPLLDGRRSLGGCSRTFRLRLRLGDIAAADLDVSIEVASSRISPLRVGCYPPAGPTLAGRAARCAQARDDLGVAPQPPFSACVDAVTGLATSHRACALPSASLRTAQHRSVSGGHPARGDFPRSREVRCCSCASRPFVRCTFRWFPTFRLPCAFKALLRRRVRDATGRCQSTAPVPSLGFLPLRGSPSTAVGPPWRPEGRSYGASIPPPIRPEPVPEGADTGVGGVCPVGGCRGCPR